MIPISLNKAISVSKESVSDNSSDITSLISPWVKYPRDLPILIRCLSLARRNSSCSSLPNFVALNSSNNAFSFALRSRAFCLSVRISAFGSTSGFGFGFLPRVFLTGCSTSTGFGSTATISVSTISRTSSTFFSLGNTFLTGFAALTGFSIFTAALFALVGVFTLVGVFDLAGALLTDWIGVFLLAGLITFLAGALLTTIFLATIFPFGDFCAIFITDEFALEDFLTGFAVFLGIAFTIFKAGFCELFLPATAEFFFTSDFFITTTGFFVFLAATAFLATGAFEVDFLTGVVFGIFARC